MSEQDKSRARAVPSSRITRITRLGALATGVAGGAAAQGLRSLARGERPDLRNMVLSPANARRVAAQLAQMRGAAMKLGQLLSMEAGDVLPPELAEILARLRAQADFMPPKQLKSVLIDHWGPDFTAQFQRFDIRPIAAASIGQVHRATAKDGRQLAIKLQYPGIARSIDSDVDNVARLLRLSGLLPSGLDLGPLLREAKRQLHEETDYQREAQNLARFGKLLGDDPGFHVPRYHPDLSQAHILVMDFAPGHAIEDLAQAGQSLRDSIASRLIDLTLRELFCFGWMQTDPNFANYLYDPATDRIVLLDFGAARPVPASMAQAYAQLLRLGLSAPQPPEPNAMAQALEALGVWGATTPARHKAVMLQMAGKLFEHLRAPGPFDFATNRLHQDLHELGMEIAQDRRIDHIPPIEMLYIQRKLAGMFLLATRLKARVDLHALIAKRLPPADAPLGAE